MNIDVFKGTISRRGGLAKPNRFNIIFPSLPPGLGSGKDLTLLCESTSFPSKQITTQDWAPFGHTIKIPTSFIQEDVACVFNITNDFYVKDLFDRWQNKVIDNEKFHINYDSEFKTNIIIHQLNDYAIDGRSDQAQVIYEYILMKAYPISVGAMMLDNNATDTVHKLSVTFAYNDFKQTKK